MTTIREWCELQFAGRRAAKFIEIGSNQFEDTAWLAELGTVWCFDPDPRVKRWRQPPRTVFAPAAVGAVDGEVDWWQSTTRDGVRIYSKSSSVLRPSLHLERHPEVRFATEPIRVPAVRLDTFFSFLGDGESIDLIWMDCQGAEALVIEGGRRVLGVTDWLYTEATEEAMYEGAPTRAEILSMLPGWRVEHEWPNDVLLRREA